MSYNIALNFEDGVTRVITCNEGETVLDAAYRAQINLPMDCSDGVCGTCKGSCHQGEFDMGDEYIDETANTLSARLAGQDAELANDIQEKVLHIFEACNFQDLTGQRITKVINTLRFIEDRIIKMMDIWGGVDAIKQHAPAIIDTRVGDARLLNGPKALDDEGHASQDDIDAMFN